MDNNGQVATIGVAEKLNEIRQKVPADKQLSWLQLAEAKNTYLETLQKMELELQAKLLNYDTMDALSLQKAIEDYKEGLKKMPEFRKGFTSYLDKIRDQLMAPEKRAATWDNFIKAEPKLVELKLAKEKENQAGAAKIQEAEKFKTHIANENAKRLANYTIALDKAIIDAYTLALKDDNLDENGVKEYIRVATDVMSQLPIPNPEKFDYKLHTKEEMMAIANQISKPDFDKPLKESLYSLSQKFSMYFHDRANKQKAVEFLKDEQEKKEKEIQANLTTQTSVNNLMSGGNVPTLMPNDGIKDLKRTNEIVIKDNDSEWARLIVAAFLANWTICFAQLRVKKFGNISIAQMASALADAGIKVEGVEYKEIFK